MREYDRRHQRFIADECRLCTERGLDPDVIQESYQMYNREERKDIKQRARAWMDAGGSRKAMAGDCGEGTAGGCTATGGSSGWSVPDFGEGNPFLPQIPTQCTTDGRRIIIPADITCYPLLTLDSVPDDAWDALEGRELLALSCYKKWRNALRAYVASFSQFCKGGPRI